MGTPAAKQILKASRASQQAALGPFPAQRGVLARDDLELHAHLLGGIDPGHALITLAEAGRPALEVSAPAVAASLPIGLVIITGSGNLDVINPPVGRLLELDPGEMAGQPYRKLFERAAGASREPEITRRALLRAADSYNSYPVVEIELKLEERRFLELSFFPLQTADGGWGILLEDVTDQRDRVSWKLELLSILAHDLRTPLATLKGHSSALLANYRHWGDSTVLEFLEALDEGADEIIRQVDRSLALTRVEAGRLGLRPEQTEIEILVDGALERMAGALGEVRIERSIPEDLPSVRVDPARIEEVLVNLLDNAVRYGNPDSGIVITGKQVGTVLEISVADHGPGIPPEKAEVIFQKYGQVQSGEGGSGLGLFISRRIVEAHGGQMWVESPAPGSDSGARFVFTLPTLPDQLPDIPPDREPAAHPPPVIADSRILIVEDEPDLQTLLRAILVESGYKIQIASDGPTAVDMVSTTEPDLILLDWILPRMDGLSVCRAVRRWSQVPILVVTSQTGQSDLIEALDAGADDYITKPFQSEELLARIRALLRRGAREGGTGTTTDGTLRAGPLELSLPRRQVRLRGREIDLTPTEFDLLAHLAQHSRQVLTHNQLISEVWGLEGGSRHSLFVHINRLRSKIEDDPRQPKFVKTRWGVGYSFAERVTGL